MSEQVCEADMGGGGAAGGDLACGESRAVGGRHDDVFHREHS